MKAKPSVTEDRNNHSNTFIKHFAKFVKSGVGRGLIALIILVFCVVSAVKLVFPRTVTPKNAPPDQFSGERAMEHLPIIAAEPHPAGSPAQEKVRDYLVQNLSDMGFEAEVQEAAGVENVVVRIKGSDPTGAIVILSHYDSVQDGPGAADNGSGVAALLEIMRTLSANPVPKNDIIALFDDGEELPDPFTGSKAFVRSHRWMQDVKVAISLDTAVAGVISTNETGQDNGWLVHVLARTHTNSATWTSISGGGGYDTTPFRDAGIMILALEDNYPFKEKHTPQDLPEIVRASSVQQMGEQTLAIARELGQLDLSNPRAEHETFFTVPILGFFHYPEVWSLPIAIIAVGLMVIMFVIAILRGFVKWQRIIFAFGSLIFSAMLSAIIINALLPTLPKVFGWGINSWPDWPEVIPPNGWFFFPVFILIVTGLAVAGYILVRRWCSPIYFSMSVLIPLCLLAVALAVAVPRGAYLFIWSGLVGSLIWAVTFFVSRTQIKVPVEIPMILAAIPPILLILPLIPGIVMGDGMKSLAILAAVWVLLLGAILPPLDGLVYHPKIKGINPVTRLPKK